MTCTALWFAGFEDAAGFDGNQAGACPLGTLHRITVSRRRSFINGNGAFWFAVTGDRSAPVVLLFLFLFLFAVEHRQLPDGTDASLLIPSRRCFLFKWYPGYTRLLPFVYSPVDTTHPGGLRRHSHFTTYPENEFLRTVNIT